MHAYYNITIKITINFVLSFSKKLRIYFLRFVKYFLLVLCFLLCFCVYLMIFQRLRAHVYCLQRSSVLRFLFKKPSHTSVSLKAPETTPAQCI